MSTTDNRIVKMVFDNATFKRAAAETKSALDKVNAAIDKAGKSKGLLNLNKDMQNVAINASKMQVATAAAIGTLASKATILGTNLIKSLTFDPIKQGFNEYGELLTKQNAIMNSTGKSSKAVKTVLNDLNTYSDKTIFQFSDMTQALTKFTNAGIGLKKSSNIIKGVGNAAAFAGLTTDKAGAAFYAVAQVMETGFLQGNDLMQLNNAGFATTKFKEEVVKAAYEMGNLRKQGDHYVTKTGKYVSATKGFKDNLKEQWASAEAVSKALAKYNDQSTKFGQKAFKSATQVRTFSAFMGTLKESLGSGWAQVFSSLFGGLEQATSMWTNLSLAIGGVINTFFNFLSASLDVWRSMGGAAEIGKALKNAFSPIAAIFTVLGKAFHNAFGGEGGKGAGSTLYGLSVAIKVLTLPLLGLAKIILLLEQPLTIFFQILRIGGLIIGGVITFLIDFVKIFISLTTFKMPSAGSTDNILGWLVALGKAIAGAVRQFKDLIQGGASIKDAFSGIDFALPALPDFKNWFKGIKIDFPSFNAPQLPKFGGFNLAGIFGGGGGGGADAEPASKIETMSTAVMQLTSNSKALDYVMTGLSENSILGSNGDFAGVVNIRELEQGMDNVKERTMGAGAVLGKFWDFIKKIGSAIGGFFSKISGEDVITAANFALLGTMGLAIAKFFNTFKGGLGVFKEVGEAAKNTLNTTSSAIKTFQTVAKSKIIMNIAIALGILAVALVVLSLIPRDKLITALMGLAGAVAALSIVMLLFTKLVAKLDGKQVTFKLYALGFAIAAVGLGMLFLASAMYIMNKVDPASVVKTLVILAVIFKGMDNIGKLAEKSGRKLIAAGIAINLIGLSLIVLAAGLLLFNLVDYESMAKAGLVITALTVALLLLGQIPAARLAKAGTAILAMAVSLLIIANALIIFQAVQWESIGKAAVVLVALGVAMLIMSSAGPTGALVMVAMGAAFLAIAIGCLALQKVSWETIAKAAVVLALIVVAFAAFMAIVSFFTPAIIVLSLFAGQLALLAVAIALLGGVLIILIPLSAAAAGAFAAFAAAAAIAIAVFLQTLAAEMPNIKKSLDKILRIFVDFVVEATPVLLDGLLDMLDALLNETPRFLKQLIVFVGQLIHAILDALASWTVDIVDAGVDLVLSLIKGIAAQAVKLAKAAVDLLLTFLQAITDNVFQLVNGAIDAFVSFMNQLADALRSNAGPLGEAVGNVVEALVELGPRFVAGLAKGIAEAPLGILTDAIGGVVSHIPGATKLLGKIHSPSRLMIPLGKFFVDGLAKGIQDNAAAVIVSTASVVTGVIATAMEYISSYVQRLDQMGIAARAKADGLAEAAKRAADAASKTEKNKKDDAAAESLQKRADKASEQADKLEEKVDKAKEKQNRQQEFADADTIDRAKMKSEDAQAAIDDAKAAEGRAAKDLAQAKALQQQANSGKYSEAESKKMRKEAEKLRADAKKEAQLANAYLQAAKADAGQALALQKQAGAEAAAAYQGQFDSAAQSAADQDAFDALSDSDKAASRRADAAALQKEAQDNLIKAKELAYTDVEAANELAQYALDQADQARQYLKDAADYEQQVADAATDAAEKAEEERKKKEGETITPTVDLTASSQAALAFANLQDIVDAATAAAAAGNAVEFNQYNTSPEALSPTEVYRQTNNLLTQAQDRLGRAA